MKNGDNNHLKIQVMVAGRQAGKTYFSGNSVLSDWAREYLCDMTVDTWLSRKNVSEADALAYPNARTAYELQQSPLYKALV